MSDESTVQIAHPVCTSAYMSRDTEQPGFVDVRIVLDISGLPSPLMGLIEQLYQTENPAAVLALALFGAMKENSTDDAKVVYAKENAKVTLN